MFFLVILIGLMLCAVSMTWWLTRFLIIWLPIYGLIDYPGPRRNHATATVRGGGISIVCTLMILGVIVLFFSSGDLWPLFVLSGMCLVALISLKDDFHHVSPWVRLFFQIIAAWIAIFYIDESGAIFFGLLPAWLDRFFVIVMWVLFMNFFNFMDGIDCISSIETCVIGGGVFFLSLILRDHIEAYFSIILIGSAIGFLYWNKTPAKIFLGDVGSVSLGYVIGALLIRIADKGHLIAALILPAYYIADSGGIVLYRAIRLHSFWHPHQDFLTHRAYLRGLSHWLISKWVGYLGIGLIIMAILSLFIPWIAFLLTVLYVIIFCRFLSVGKDNFFSFYKK